jgi:hypothetical protein
MVLEAARGPNVQLLFPLSRWTSEEAARSSSCSTQSYPGVLIWSQADVADAFPVIFDLGVAKLDSGIVQPFQTRKACLPVRRREIEDTKNSIVVLSSKIGQDCLIAGFQELALRVSQAWIVSPDSDGLPYPV